MLSLEPFKTLQSCKSPPVGGGNSMIKEQIKLIVSWVKFDDFTLTRKLTKLKKIQPYINHLWVNLALVQHQQERVI